MGLVGKNEEALTRLAAVSSSLLRKSPAFLSWARNTQTSQETAGLENASDEELMVRVAQGDESAFRCLAGRHAPKTFALTRRVLGNDADAEDIVQEAMLRVWVTAPRWRPDAAFKTWLYRVTMNLCLNRQRHKPFAPLDAAAEPPDPSPNAADVLERREADGLVAKAIEALPERQRAAIVLTYYEGLSNAETASVLETTISSVETLLVRAKRTLRAKLGAIPDAAS
jgi:RNA polymerase sigma-70 factor (ECF subfamily)